jgi:hypothetical protein
MHIIVKHVTLNAVVSFECRLMTCLSGSKPTNADFPLLEMLPSCHPGDYGGGSAGQRVAASSQGPPSKTGRSGGCPSSGVRGRPRLRSKTALGPRGATRGPRKNLSPPRDTPHTRPSTPTRDCATGGDLRMGRRNFIPPVVKCAGACARRG